MAPAKRKQREAHNLDVIEGGNSATEAALAEIPYTLKASRETSQYQEHGSQGTQ
ncbi:MAG: hypothetical protein Ct9H90mP30_5510 [Actinomycetota bacterium]|nr:MAG: hypothetical protein Ct9H90mP30_5510 [Actinomycetota bacterium]